MAQKCEKVLPVAVVVIIVTVVITNIQGALPVMNSHTVICPFYVPSLSPQEKPVRQ